mgnify:CR=1 FL=1
MEMTVHTMNDLFRQLGLPDDDRGIERFLLTHRLPRQSMLLAEARFWKPSQAAFLREALSDDADWAEIVDALDASLRH